MLPLSLLASLAALASLDAEVGVRAETRTAVLAPEGAAAERRQGWLTAATARLALETPALRLAGSYAPRFWTSDVEGRPSPIFAQDAELRLETHHREPWSAELGVNVSRGRTDPLADPGQLTLATRGALSATTLDPVPYQGGRASARASLPFDLRTTLAGSAAAWQSGGVDAEARASLPTQRGASVELTLAHRLDPRDTLQLRAGASGTTTALVARQVDATGAIAFVGSGDARTAWASLAASWRRRLTPLLTGWAGGGAAFSAEEEPRASTLRSWFAIADAGATYELPRATITATARVDPYVDRLTATVGPMVLASLTGEFRWTPRLSLSLAAAGGSRTGGETALASLDATARYALRERLHVELGLLGRWQHERDPALPSFSHGAVVAAIAWGSGPL